MLFWILAFALAAAAAAYATTPLWSGRTRALSRAAHDAQVYKSQLREIERDLARGALAAEEAEGARREIGRKLLTAATEAENDAGAEPAAARISRLGAGGAAALLVIGGTVVYLLTGAPGAPDRPLAGRNFLAERLEARLSQADAEAVAAENRAAALEGRVPPQPPDLGNLPEGLPEGTDFATLVARMEAVLAERPDDAQGRLILARAYTRLDRAPEAWPLLAEARRLLGDRADPELAVDQAETMVIAAGGYVSREAELVFREVPDAPRSRYFIALARAQEGDLRQAVIGWAGLLQDYPDAPFAPLVRRQISQAGEQLGVDVSAFLGGGAPRGAEPDAPGPSREDVEAAAEMSAEDRSAMIEGMVARLADKLEDEPQDIAGWMRLIRAYGVLGRLDEAQQAYDRAKGIFEDDTPNLRNLAEAAVLAGLEP